jgi:NAD kinase
MNKVLVVSKPGLDVKLSSTLELLRSRRFQLASSPLDPVDFCMTLGIHKLRMMIGGDGTMLHLSSLFPCKVPPVVSFSLGTLGFLVPFRFQQMHQVLDALQAQKMKTVLRHRLRVLLKHQQKLLQDVQVMNDVVIHRHKESHLTSIDCFVNG